MCLFDAIDTCFFDFEWKIIGVLWRNGMCASFEVDAWCGQCRLIHATKVKLVNNCYQPIWSDFRMNPFLLPALERMTYFGFFLFSLITRWFMEGVVYHVKGLQEQHWRLTWAMIHKTILCGISPPNQIALANVGPQFPSSFIAELSKRLKVPNY